MIRTASSRLSKESQVIMDAQTEVKQFVKKMYMQGASLGLTLANLANVIKKYLDEISNEQLRYETRKSLWVLARKSYVTLASSETFGNIALLLAVLALYNDKLSAREKRNAQRIVMGALPHLFGQTSTTWHTWKLPYGTQANLRVKYYMKDVVRTVQRFAGLKAEYESDADYTKRKNSMRAVAEIVVRQQNHDNQINEFRANGVKLVIISTHADCSKRCSGYQGRVYSLDGTTGTTPDGRHYEPLETATEVYVTTKAGRRWKNGLFGFNCRHHMIEYVDGVQPPMVDEKQRKREVAIDQRQRAYEREIVKAREEAIAYKGVDDQKYREWKKRSSELMSAYIQYSHKHGRPYYTSRVKIL